MLFRFLGVKKTKTQKLKVGLELVIIILTSKLHPNLHVTLRGINQLFLFLYKLFLRTRKCDCSAVLGATCF